MTDLLFDDNNDLRIENGDFVIGESTSQEIEQIVTSAKGNFKSSPLLGVDVVRMIKSRETEVSIKRDIDEQLKNDGFKKISTVINYPIVTVNAER